MNDIKEHKLIKERGESPRRILEHLLKDIDDVSSVVVTAHFEDGYVQTAYSHEDSLKALGMLDVSKDEIIDSMKSE